MMKKRIAKKIRKSPWKYCVTQIKKAYRAYKIHPFLKKLEQHYSLGADFETASEKQSRVVGFLGN